MRYEFFTAKKFLKKNNKFLSIINLISILGITLGVAALIIVFSVVNGFEKELKNKIENFSSHIKFFTTQKGQTINNNFDFTSMKMKVKNIKKIYSVLSYEIIIKHKENVEGVLLKGIDQNYLDKTLKQYLVEGKFFNNNSQYEIIIGKKLANKLNVNIGEEIVFFYVDNLQNEKFPRVKKFKIIGIYESQMSEYDDIFVYTNIFSAQNFIDIKNGINQIDFFLNDISQIENDRNSIKSQIGYPLISLTIFQEYRNLFQWIELQKTLNPLAISIIIIVASINIIGTISITIFDKTKQIGILKSLGAKINEIQKIFFYHGITIGIIGILFGNLLGILLCLLEKKMNFFLLPQDIYFMNKVPIFLSFHTNILISLFALFLVFIFSFIPTKIISKIEIIESFRFA